MVKKWNILFSGLKIKRINNNVTETINVKNSNIRIQYIILQSMPLSPKFHRTMQCPLPTKAAWRFNEL